MSGELGIRGITEKQLDFAKVPTLIPVAEEVIGGSCGGNFTVLIGKSNKLYAFGKNSLGQLGLGHTKNVSTPTVVEALIGHEISDIILSGFQSLFFAETY